MSRPQTPLERSGRPFSHGNGISPRGSFVNVADAAEPGSPLMRDEKERARAEQEVREALLKKEKEDKESAAPAESSVPPIVAYCLASISMVLLNKWVLSGTHFDMTFLLLTIQSSVCVACVLIAKRFGLVQVRDWDIKDARAWFPVSALLVAVIYSGAKALQFLSIPVFTIFKNLTIILIAYGEVLWFGGRVTGLTLVAFALMVGSSVIAGWSDIATSLAKMSTEAQAMLDSVSGLEAPLDGVKGGARGFNPGYSWMAINCFASAAYVLYMRKKIKITGFNDWTSMYHNNFSSIPILVVFSLILEDWSSASLERNFPSENRILLLTGIAISGAAAVGISFTTAWCVRVAGSTTYSMVGALNKLPVAASGMLFFGDPANIGNVSAICVGGVAGVVYSVAKINQGKMDRAKAARDGGKA